MTNEEENECHDEDTIEINQRDNNNNDNDENNNDDNVKEQKTKYHL